MLEHILIIHPGGKVRSLAYHDGPDLTCLGPGRKWRASHVEPVWPVKRLLFHALRHLFGECGRIADWTRRWRGPWRVHIIGRGILLSPGLGGWWDSRADAITAEVEFFHRHMKGDMAKPIRYLLTRASATCPDCNGRLRLLSAVVSERLPIFYICWKCSAIFQAGVGLVKEVG